MLIKLIISFIFIILQIRLVFADIVDVNNKEIIELLNANTSIVDVRRNFEWEQTGVIPNSILLTFFDDEGNYNFDKWYEELSLEVNVNDPIILICRSGNRSKIIAKMMDEKYDNKFYNAKNGIKSWINANLITVKP